MSAVLKETWSISTDEKIIGPWVCERTGIDMTDSMQAIGNVFNGDLVCGVLYDNYNHASIYMHCAGIGHYLTPEYLRAVFDYPFNYLKVKKAIGVIDSSNAKALKMIRGFGFVDEARIKGAAKGGDLVFLTMTREQCRFLGDGNEKS